MSKITYHQQFSYCGKPHCRKCREGIGHGPYWYAYQTVNGRTIRRYVGKRLPVGVQLPPGKGGQPPTAIRVFALGGFGGLRLERRSYNWQWQAVADAEWRGSIAQSLLGYLISCPARQADRAQVRETLWPGLAGNAADLQLEESVSVLRRLLQPARKRKGQGYMLHSDGEWFGLAGQEALWVDADAFEALLSQARGSLDPEQTEQLLEEALLLYGGDYLPEERMLPVVQARRERLQRSWIGLLLDLADLYIARNALSGAVDALDQLLATDPTNEAAVQRLVILLAQSGRRAEALRVYQHCADALKRDYGMRPSRELQELYEAIRGGVKLSWDERHSSGK